MSFEAIWVRRIERSVTVPDWETLARTAEPAFAGAQALVAAVRLAILYGIWMVRRINGPRRYAAFKRMKRELRERERCLEEMQARMVEADRLALVGTLVAGVAHEVNNPMAYVIANVEYACSEIAQLVAKEKRSDLGELTKSLDDCRSGTERVRAIMSDLRVVARKDTEDPREAVDVHKILDGAIKIANAEMRRKATIECAYSETPAVLANESRLGQVFLNLLVNATQAFPSEAPSLNRIRTSTSVDPSGSVVIEVADNGSGVPENLHGKIFDPFFTTKTNGTGLGLSISHGIVTSLGGRISVQSKPGKGTTFRVVLPAAPLDRNLVRQVEQTPAPRRRAQRKTTPKTSGRWTGLEPERDGSAGEAVLESCDR